MRKLTVNFKLSEYIDPQVIRIYVLVLVSVLLIAFLVVIGVNIYQFGVAREEMKKPGLYTEQDISSILKSPGLTDFIIPESLETSESSFSFYREPVKMWTDEMVERYIIPPEELGIDSISNESRNLIERKLDTIP